MSVILIARWYAKEDMAEKVADILPRLAERSESEPGCLMFRPVRSMSDGRAFTLFEEYENEAALESHRRSAHFRDLVLGEVVPLLDEREVGLFTDV